MLENINYKYCCNLRQYSVVPWTLKKIDLLQLKINHKYCCNLRSPSVVCWTLKRADLRSWEAEDLLLSTLLLCTLDIERSQRTPVNSLRLAIDTVVILFIVHSYLGNQRKRTYSCLYYKSRCLFNVQPVISHFLKNVAVINIYEISMVSI